MNWTPRNIFDTRDKLVISKNSTKHQVRLYPDGWSIGHLEALDVFSACRYLNDIEATIFCDNIACEYLLKCSEDQQKADYCPLNK